MFCSSGNRHRGGATLPLALHLRNLADKLNPILRGWINYYGRFGIRELNVVFMLVNCYIAKWASKKYKNLKQSWSKGFRWLAGVARRQPELFVHWRVCKCTPT